MIRRHLSAHAYTCILFVHAYHLIGPICRPRMSKRMRLDKPFFIHACSAVCQCDCSIYLYSTYIIRYQFALDHIVNHFKDRFPDNDEIFANTINTIEPFEPLNSAQASWPRCELCHPLIFSICIVLKTESTD